MTTASVGVNTRLKNGAGLTAVPIRPKVRDTADDFPAIVYNVVSAAPTNSLDGFSRLTRFIYQIDVWARTYNQALALAIAARDAMIGTNTTDFVAIYVDRREDYDNELKIHNVQLDFSVTSTQD